MHSRVLTLAIVVVLLAFFSVPMGIMLYGGGAAAIGGFVMLGVLIVLQFPVYKLFRRLRVLSPASRNDDHS